MAVALGLAQRGLGRVWPNPSVGCVIVKDGRVVGRGFTQPKGRPHAETEALRHAGEKARGATCASDLSHPGCIKNADRSAGTGDGTIFAVRRA